MSGYAADWIGPQSAMVPKQECLLEGGRGKRKEGFYDVVPAFEFVMNEKAGIQSVIPNQ